MRPTVHVYEPAAHLHNPPRTRTFSRPFAGKWRAGAPSLAVPPPSKNPAVATAAREAALGGRPIAAVLRLTLEGCSHFDEAMAALDTSRLLAPCYVLAAGCTAGQAALLSCGAGTERSVARLSSGGVLVVTNLDPTPEETPPLPPPTGAPLGAVEAKDFVQVRVRG